MKTFLTMLAAAAALAGAGGAGAQESARLVVTVQGGGSVSGPGIACPGDCEETLPGQGAVTLSAQAAPGFAFAGWRGACAGTEGCEARVGAATYVGARFVLAAAAPRLLRGDHDSDGIPDADDACAGTPPGAALLRDGCAVADLVRDGDALLGALRTAGGRVDTSLGGVRELAELAAGVGRSLDVFDQGALLLEQGDVCGAARVTAEGARGLDATAADGRRRISELQAAVTAERGAADTDAKELRWAGLNYRGGLLDAAAARGGEVERTVGAACAALGPELRLTGRIESTDDAAGVLRLEDGTVLAIPARASTGPVWAGASVAVTAQSPGAGPALADSLTLLDHPLGPVVFPPCMTLLIAPVQDFANDPTPVLHDPKGYRWNGVYWLERGMRLAASPECAAAKPGRYSLQLVLDGPGPAFTVAPDLDANDAPVAIPVQGGDTAWTLTVIERFQGSNCPPPGETARRGPARQAKYYPCPLQELSQTVLDVRVRPGGSYGTAVYAAEQLPVEDNGFALDEVTGFTGLHWTIGSPGFAGEAYKVTPTQIPSAFQTIGLGEEFAVLPDEWYGAPLAVPLQTIGVDHFAGITWPRIVGTRNGGPFRYRAQLPTLVKDLLPGCAQPDCFYRLPWSGGELETTVQGNGPGYSHNDAQLYAFDFVMPLFTPMRATRGGIVGDLQESLSKNANPCAVPDAVKDLIDAPSNYLRIDHQDGTYSYYAHMLQGSIVPEVGDVVKRGDLIAITGNVGRSCGPHLHYQVAIDKTNTIYGQTKQICFEGAIVWPLGKLGLFPCFIPATDDVLQSTNS